jgi:hypothetical protein
VLTDVAGNPITELDPDVDDPLLGGGDFFVTVTTGDAQDLATYAQRITFDSDVIRFVGLFMTGLQLGLNKNPGDLKVNGQHANTGPSSYLVVSAIGIEGYTGPQTLARLAFEVLQSGVSGTVGVADDAGSTSPYSHAGLGNIEHTDTGQSANFTTGSLGTPTVTPPITATFTPTWTIPVTETTFTPTPTLTWTPTITPTFTATETPFTPTPTPIVIVFGDLDANGKVAEATDSLLWALTWQSQFDGPGSYNAWADYELDGDVDRNDLDRYLELTRQEALPTVPKIVISEFQVKPLLTFETRGEFVELYNNDTVDIDLFGWALADNEGDLIIISKHLIISPSEAVVLANTMDPCENGGLEPDFVYSAQGSVHFRLDNTGDEIILLNQEGQVVDMVIYRNEWLPVVGGVTFRLLFPGLDNLRVFDPFSVLEFPCEEANWWYSSFLYDGIYGTYDFPWCETNIEQTGTPGMYSRFLIPDPFGCGEDGF